MKDTCNYPDGTFIGIITDIQTVEKPYPSVTVTAALAINGKIASEMFQQALYQRTRSIPEFLRGVRPVFRPNRTSK